MKLGIALRSMGPQSAPDTLLACARAAEAAGLDDVWVQDHLAIPPDDAEGSDGRYLDPLTALAWLAGATERIGLGTGVLNLPYRPPLPTAKAIATVQELSGGRLRVGVGVGWMASEFRALGVPRSRRGALTDETLEFLHRCFDADSVTENGQAFLFKPRPARPPLYIGGAPPHALARTVRWGDGWMPMVPDPDKLAPMARQLNALAAEAGRPKPAVVALSGLPLADPARSRERLARFEQAGATHFVHGMRYDDAAQFAESAEALGKL